MTKRIGIAVFVWVLAASPVFGQEFVQPTAVEPVRTPVPAAPVNYMVGVDDVLDIGIIKPEPIGYTVTVAPDGAITFPYIGNVRVQGLTLPGIQTEIQG